MVRLPFIQIPSVRVGGIDPTSDTSLAYGAGEVEEPTPIQYLTAWRLVGNSEVHDTEIWSCGELSATDNKYHIYVQSNGKTFDIALTEPLRKVNDVVDKIEFANGVATVTRCLDSVKVKDLSWIINTRGVQDTYMPITASLKNIIKHPAAGVKANILCASYEVITNSQLWNGTFTGIGVFSNGNVSIYDSNYNQSDNCLSIINNIQDECIIYELETPTTETIIVPDIEVSSTDTYTQVISQGAKAVAWYSFTANPEPEEEEE